MNKVKKLHFDININCYEMASFAINIITFSNIKLCELHSRPKNHASPKSPVYVVSGV